MANIEVDGPNKTIKVDSGDLTFDIPGDIVLDADGANVTFKDGGTSVLDLSNSSTDAVLTVSTQDKDLIIKGDDGGSAVTAATFDMSDAGTLVLNHDLRIGDAGQIGSASDADAIAIASNGVVTFSQAPVFPDGSLNIADIDLDGGTDIGAAIVDADLFLIDDGAGGTMRKTAASRLKTYIGGGITQADQWRVTGTTTGSETPIASNWERADNSWEEIGDGMTESSGVFTFPATGKWLILAKFIGNAVNVDENTAYFNLQVTTDNSSYTTRAQAGFNAPGSSTYSSSSSIGGTLVHLLDVTNTSNDKVRLTTESFQSATQTNGDTNGNLTCIAFIKLADT